jgi:hypothetical protein
VIGCKSNALRRSFLKKTDLTLTVALEIGRAFDTVEAQAQAVEGKNAEEKELIDMVEPKKSFKANRKPNKAKSFSKQTDKFKRQTASDKAEHGKKCFKCGGSFPHDQDCPAKGKKCNKCGKLNHFKRVCKSSTKNIINQSKRIT